MDVTRFAPSPTGYLHLGHAASALFAAARGTMLLRIEDIDLTRCKPEFEAAIYEDLAWLGLTWPLPVRRQSDHFADYTKAIDTLKVRELLYPCFCSRTDIARAPQGEKPLVYPGRCRHLSNPDLSKPHAWRLDVQKAMKRPLFWTDLAKGRQEVDPAAFGDVVLARKETPASYHLCVTHDDALQGVTLVTRGDDLFDSTPIHRLLQDLFGWPVPEYEHHPLLRDEAGQRLAKRDGARSLREMREAGVSAAEIRERAGRF